MADKFSDPIGRLMGLRYKSHPWHGVYIGDKAPEKVTAFIEVVLQQNNSETSNNLI